MGASRYLFRAGVLGTLVVAMGVLRAVGAHAQSTEEVPDASCQAQTSAFVGITDEQAPPNDVARAQTFTAQNSGQLTTVQVKLGDQYDTGTPVMELRTVDTSDTPTVTVLASTAISASEIPGPEITTVTGSFSPGAEVVAGQQYALVLNASGGGAQEAQFNWAGNYQAPCPGSEYDSVNGGAFTPASNMDLFFSAFVTPAPPACDIHVVLWGPITFAPGFPFGFEDPNICVSEARGIPDAQVISEQILTDTFEQTWLQ